MLCGWWSRGMGRSVADENEEVEEEVEADERVRLTKLGDDDRKEDSAWVATVLSDDREVARWRMEGEGVEGGGGGARGSMGMLRRGRGEGGNGVGGSGAEQAYVQDGGAANRAETRFGAAETGEAAVGVLTGKERNVLAPVHAHDADGGGGGGRGAQRRERQRREGRLRAGGMQAGRRRRVGRRRTERWHDGAGGRRTRGVGGGAERREGEGGGRGKGAVREEGRGGRTRGDERLDMMAREQRCSAATAAHGVGGGGCRRQRLWRGPLARRRAETRAAGVGGAAARRRGGAAAAAAPLRKCSAQWMAASGCGHVGGDG
ncbi:hydroxyproline-rich glycoprotein DZ-HRGP [Gracilaria domingensis]|nr:hydroxyproline-rich glycoprotein DZ-HRGP [Gracilaria domingensis]